MKHPMMVFCIAINILATLVLGITAEAQAQALLSLMRAVVQLQLKQPAHPSMKQSDYDPSNRRA